MPERPTEDIAIPRVEVALLLNRAYSVLTDLELTYFLHIAQGKSYPEIARDYGVSRQAVNDAFKRAVEKLKR